MKRWLKRHLLKYREKKPWEFCWKITLEAFFVALIFAALLIFIVGDKRNDIDSIMTGSAVKILIVIGIILPNNRNNSVASISCVFGQAI
jgi:magnesium-transporting ATPase (P-type)